MDAQLTRIIVTERISRYQREAADDALARIVRDGRPRGSGIGARLLRVLRGAGPSRRTTTTSTGAASRAATPRTGAAS